DCGFGGFGEFGRHRYGFRHRRTGHPHPTASEPVGVLGGDVCWRSIRHHHAALVEYDDTIDLGEPRRDPVLDDDQGRARTAHRIAHGSAYCPGVVLVEHRRRFVEKQHPRPERENPGEREPLRLTTGKRAGRMVDRVREAYRLERLTYAR